MKEKSRVTIICAIITAVAGIIAGGSQIELKNAQTASIVTADDTNRDSNMSVEVYVDDVLVGRVDDIIRDEHVRPISVSVNGGNVLMIKLIRSTNYYSVAYISDAYLSTLQ